MRDSVPRGEGERRDASRRRKRWLIVGALAVAGFIPGLYLGYNDGVALAESRSSIWSPTLSLGLVVLYLAAVIGGGLLLRNVTDEVERQNSYKAASAAGMALMIVYPVWFLLWRGGFVPEPVHWMLFLLFWLSLALASLFYRFR
jgi:cytochrome bd-type quinol oxidase subunit 2